MDKKISLSFLLPLSILLCACASSLDGVSSSDGSSSSSSQLGSSSETPSVSSASSESSSSASERFAFSLTVSGEGGTASANLPDGTYDSGTEITLTAELSGLDSVFDGFFLGGDLLSDETEYSFTLEGDSAVEARFHIEDSGEYVYQTFSHKFNQNEFSGTGYSTTAGSTEINGLTWSYDAFTFLGQSSDGIQIGSKKAPQTTPWNLSADFGEEAVLTSLSVSGKFDVGTAMTVSGSDEPFEQLLKDAAYKVFTFDDLNLPMSQITISLSTTSKAFYFDTLSFTLRLSRSTSLHLTTDEGEATPAVPGENGIPDTKYEPIAAEEYYAGIDLSLEGDDLKNALYGKISQMTAYSYGTDTELLLYTDANPENGGYLYGIYDGDDILAADNGVWNKEHVWACSQMGLGGEFRPDSDTKNKSSDLHNLRVSCQNSNGAHGNKFYDVETNDVSFFPNIEGEANSAHNYSGDHRGDVARILFYMATRYPELHLNDALDGSDDMSMGKLSVLLEWNKEDPVDEFETQRNNRIYEYQGNRNPYIDHPELADKVFAA